MPNFNCKPDELLACDSRNICYPRKLFVWLFCNVVSPHEQSGLYFSRTRLAFFCNLPYQLRCPSHHQGMAAISGLAKQNRKMNALRLGSALGLSIQGEQQLIGEITLVNFPFFRKSGNEEA